MEDTALHSFHICPCSWLSSFLSRGLLHRFSIVSRLDSVGGSTNVVYPSCVPSKNRVLFDPRVVRVVSRITRGAESLLIDHDRLLLGESANLPCIRRGFHAARCPRELTKLRVDKNRLLYLSGLSLSFVIAHSRQTPDSPLLVARIGYSDLTAARKRATRKLSRASVRE